MLGNMQPKHDVEELVIMLPFLFSLLGHMKPLNFQMETKASIASFLVIFIVSPSGPKEKQ